MKDLIGILLVYSIVTLSGCALTPNDADAEIKNLVKDIPIPTFYNKDNGEELQFDKITVTKVGGMSDYDSLTGKDNRHFTVRATYEGHFWSVGRSLKLFLEKETSFPTYWLTIDDIRDNTNKLYWE
ncbi:hypothetical protein LCGC14_1191430 [marine sediment metagenome]|uniref:Uncharacterized protein n=1 Tax=marine sediment metagenome TaxID=412755 RepID=A0A0F9P1V9_9ZZZZ